jgi:hypothetical protein
VSYIRWLSSRLCKLTLQVPWQIFACAPIRSYCNIGDGEKEHARDAR